jgi:hypothetical protein
VEEYRSSLHLGNGVAVQGGKRLHAVPDALDELQGLETADRLGCELNLCTGFARILALKAAVSIPSRIGPPPASYNRSRRLLLAPVTRKIAMPPPNFRPGGKSRMTTVWIAKGCVEA